MLPGAYREAAAARRIALIAASFERLLGRVLVGPGQDVVTALWQAPQAIVAHGSEPDPLFFFGNRAALAKFQTTPAAFIGMPSRLSAGAPLQAERQALLDRVRRDGYIDDYAGMRIAATGERFRIEHAIVWNLIDEAGSILGQAAAFAA